MFLLTHDTLALPDLRAPGAVLLEKFQEAYDHFNRTLFHNKLTPCVIIVARKRAAYGYFWNGKWEKNGRKLHEIAINPDWLNSRPLGEVLSTLVHEMVHQWQHDHGKVTKVHHNRQWANKMKAIGLHPSSTGQPGGKELGMRVSHYIIDGGPFAAANAALLEKKSFELPVNVTNRFGFVGVLPKGPKYRVTVRCPECRMSALTKEGNKMLCAEHGLVMLTEDEIANGDGHLPPQDLLTKIQAFLNVGANLAEKTEKTGDDETA
jgi:predicted SprT family Zn-dependent metalloprotease